MTTHLTASVLRKIKADVAKGLAPYEIARRHGVDRSNIVRRIKRNDWEARLTASEAVHELSAHQRFAMKRDDAVDHDLVRRHAADWKTVRLLIQRAIDGNDQAAAEHARTCAEALEKVHAGETTLRGLLSKGRLRARPLHLKKQTTTRNFDYSDSTTAKMVDGPRAAKAAVQSIEELLSLWREASIRISPKTMVVWTRAVRRLAAFVGTNDPAVVTRADVLRYRDALVMAGLRADTVQGTYIAAPRTVWQYGVDNLLVAENPFANLKTQEIGSAPKPRGRTQGFTSEEAHMVLSAAHAVGKGSGRRNDTCCRWVPWLLAFSGARLGEVIQLRREDVAQTEDVWVLRISPDAGAVKSAMPRIVPLHPQLLEAGFVEFAMNSKGGYLFGDSGTRDGLFARRDALCLFVRGAGITDKRLSPNHAWRHRFKTLCRSLDIPMDYHDAITGHRSRRSRGEDYGEYPASALYREICKLPYVRVG